jgi:hypothetical protein
MTISLKITHELWKSLDLEFLAPWDQEAQSRLLDLGLSWVRKTDDFVTQICDVVDKEKFFLSVIEYGIVYEELNCSM